jgi:hypothetical protein
MLWLKLPNMYFFKKKNLIASVCLLWLATFSITSCNLLDDGIAEPYFSPDYILPLANGSLTLANITQQDSGIIQTSPTGYFKVGFRDTVFEQVLGEQLAAVQDIPQFPTSISFENSGSNHIIKSQDFTFDLTLPLQLSKITQLILVSGKLKLIIVNNKNFAFTNLQWEIPGLKFNGLPYISPVIENINSGASDSTIIDLTNADWDLRGNLDSNSLMYIKLNVLSGTNIGSQSGLAYFNLSMSDVDVGYSVGRYFTIDFPEFKTTAEVLPAEFYKNIKGGSMNLKEAKVTLDFDNTSGLPFLINVKVSTKNGVNGRIDSLKTGDLNILKAELGPSAVVNSFVLDDAKGFGKTISNFPTIMSFSAKVGINQNPNSLDHFIYKRSALKLFVDAEIPFSIAFDSLKLQDTVAFALLRTLGEQIDTSQAKLDTGTLDFTISNGFPYTINIDLLAMNGAYDPITNLASLKIDGASTAIVDGEEKVISPRVSFFNVTITQQLFDRLKSARYIQVKALLNTPAGVVSPKIYTDYKLDFDTKGRLKLTIDPFSK